MKLDIKVCSNSIRRGLSLMQLVSKLFINICPTLYLVRVARFKVNSDRLGFLLTFSFVI